MVRDAEPRQHDVVVVHVGPHIDSLGGTQTVIRVLRDHKIGADRLTVLPTWTGSSHTKNLRLVVHAARALARVSPQTVVHFHISNGGAWLREGVLIMLARARRLRTVVTLHGFDFPEFARDHGRLVGTVLSRAGHVICLSAEAQDEVVRLLRRPDRVTVVANPVPIDWDSPPAGSVPPVALFAGTVELRKGVDVLVEAWKQILDRDIPGHCRIVGPIHDFAPPKLDRMSLEAAVPQSGIARLLREVRVVVLPSRAEAMPMILTEALAAGRPFVATPVGGVPTITPEADMLVPVGDVDALANAIARYLESPQLAQEAGLRGQRYVARTRSPEVLDQILRRIYGGLP